VNVYLRKVAADCLAPASDEDAEKLNSIGLGRIVLAEVTQQRNSLYHRKFMKMLRVGFDAFEPEVKEYKGFVVQKEFEQFREDVTISAGYYTVTTRLNGTIRVRAKSIRFGRMKQPEFEQVYGAVSQVLLDTVLKNYSRQDLENVVNELLGFV
jgi:hypothetical protein